MKDGYIERLAGGRKTGELRTTVGLPSVLEHLPETAAETSKQARANHLRPVRVLMCKILEGDKAKQPVQRPDE